MTVARVTQEAVESVSQVNANARASQVAVELASANALNAHITQLSVEMVSENVADDVDSDGPMMILIST